MANVYTVNEILFGALSDRPAAARNIILWIDKDTGLGSLSDGTTWNSFGGGGASITDATTSAIGGVEVDHARSGSHSVALTTDGVALPAGMIGTASNKACAGNDARLSDARVATTHLVTVTDTYAVLTTDQVILVGVSTKTITLPAASAVAPGYAFDIKNTDTGDTTTVATVAGNIDGVATYTDLAAALAAARFVSDGTNYWVI